MNRTLKSINSELSRAINRGDRSVSVNVDDLQELLAEIDRREKIQMRTTAKYHVGWARPGSIFALKSGRKSCIRITRQKHEGFDIQLFCVERIGEGGEV